MTDKRYDSQSLFLEQIEECIKLSNIEYLSQRHTKNKYVDWEKELSGGEVFFYFLFFWIIFSLILF